MSDDYNQLVRDHILDERNFVRATLSGRRHGQFVPWRKVVVRPVLIKNVRHLQISYFDDQKDITKNYTGATIAVKVDELLALPFKSIYIQTTGHSIQVQITKKGKALIHRHDVAGRQKTPSLQHDHRKNLLLPADKPDPFLQAMDIMTGQGRVRASKRKKFRQINHFLKLVLETGIAELGRSPLHIVDCGCGNADLTLAVYHYLNHILGVPAHFTGIDVDRGLIRKRSEQSHALGWPDLAFQVVRIVDFEPTTPPDVVFALHACDTATDEALAQAIKWQSEMIFVVPCCHHHLQQQLDQRSVPPQFRPVFRHGILRERLGDILTDTFRSLTLRIAGYHTDVIEFISTEHTDKNLMIRAIKSSRPRDALAIQEYRDLRQFFQVVPYLEQLLGAEPRSDRLYRTLLDNLSAHDDFSGQSAPI